MISDEERREAARRLRGLEVCELDGEFIDCGEVEDALGLVSDDGVWYEAEGVMRLADLLVPSEEQNGPDASVDSGCGIRVDRGALLELADEMGSADPEDLDVAIDFVTECASRIREALGVWRWS